MVSGIPFDWFYFLLALAGVIAIRVAFRRRLFFQATSLETAATLGIILFLVLPIGFYSHEFFIPTPLYLVHVLLGYLLFCIAFSLARGRQQVADSLSGPFNVDLMDPRVIRIVTIVCTLFALQRLFAFVVAGGFGRILDVWSSAPLYSFLSSASDLPEVIILQPSYFLLEALQVVFVLFWGILFRARPKYAVVLWLIYSSTILQSYTGRSWVVRYIVLPWICYVHYKGLSTRKIVGQALLGFAIILAIMAWMDPIRAGVNPGVSAVRPSEILYNLRSMLVPAQMGTFVLNSSLRGDPVEFLLGMLTFPIPRFLWPGKPYLEINLLLTHFFAGVLVGPGQGVIVFTMLGEGWFHFGAVGSMVILALFGFLIGFLERTLSRSAAFIGVQAYMVTFAIVQVRSMFFTFYSRSIITLAVSLLAIFLLGSILTAHRNEHAKHSVAQTYRPI